MYGTLSEAEQLLAETTGPQRVKPLCLLSERLLADDPERSLSLAHEALALAQHTGDTHLLVHALQHLCYLHYCHGNSDTALQYFESGWNILADDDMEGRVLLMMRRAGILHAQDRPEEALVLLRAAVELCPEHFHCRVSLLLNTGFVYTGAGLYDCALETLFKALEILTRTTDNPPAAALCLANIADVYGALGDMDNVRTYALRGLALCDIHDRTGRLCRVKLLTILGISACGNKEYATALQQYDEALSLLRPHEETGHRSQILQYKGKVYTAIGDSNRALEYFRQALALAEAVGQQSAIAAILLALAEIQEQTGEHTTALATYHRALALTGTCAPYLRVRILGSIAELCESIGQQEESYSWYKQHIDLRERLRGEEVQRRVGRIALEYNLRKAQLQAASLQGQVERLERESERIEHELSAMALNLIHRREGLLRLRGELQKETQRLKGSHRKAATALLHSIDRQLAPDDDWALFTRQFDKAHAEFTARMLAKCPELTPTELRICALLRLNSSSKDIAHLLCISAYTVNTHRRNIRRKLGLEETANLATTLAQL